MHWAYSAIFTVVSLAFADFFIKLTAGKVSSSLALLLYGSCTFLAGLSWVVVELIRKEKLFASPTGIATGIAVGIAFSCVTFGLYATFAKVPVSIGSPLIRIGGILLVSLAGIFILREKLSLQYILGMVLAVSGIALIVSHSLRS